MAHHILIDPCLGCLAQTLGPLPAQDIQDVLPPLYALGASLYEQRVQFLVTDRDGAGISSGCIFHAGSLLADDVIIIA
jgi:hypothetical protein